jgi:hypothetical protein
MFIFVPTKAVSALEKRSSPGQGAASDEETPRLDLILNPS